MPSQEIKGQNHPFESFLLIANLLETKFLYKYLVVLGNFLLKSVFVGLFDVDVFE